MIDFEFTKTNVHPNLIPKKPVFPAHHWQKSLLKFQMAVLSKLAYSVQLRMFNKLRKEKNLLSLTTWICCPASDKHNAVFDFAFAKYHTLLSVICLDEDYRFAWNLYLDPKFNAMFDFSICQICSYTHIFSTVSF